MLCSNPLPTKAKRHQKISRSFAASLLVRPDIQTARQTSQLHKIPRINNSQPERLIFVATALNNKSDCGACESTPDCAINQASPNEPARLPINETPQMRPSIFQVIVSLSAPIAQTRLFPVNNSEPAKITKVSATP